MLVIPGNAPQLTVGGRVFTDMKNLIVLQGLFNGAANGNLTFCRTGSSTAYTPSGSKAFRMMAIRVQTNVAFGAGTGGHVVYSDNNVGMATNTAFTNRVNNAAAGDVPTLAVSSLSAYECPIDLLVPNAKYAGFSNNASAAVGCIYAFGYEE